MRQDLKLYYRVNPFSKITSCPIFRILDLIHFFPTRGTLALFLLKVVLCNLEEIPCKNSMASFVKFPSALTFWLARILSKMAFYMPWGSFQFVGHVITPHEDHSCFRIQMVNFVPRHWPPRKRYLISLYPNGGPVIANIWRVVVPCAPQGWSSHITLKADPCATLSPYYFFYTQILSLEIFYLLFEAHLLPSNMCGFPYEICFPIYFFRGFLPPVLFEEVTSGASLWSFISYSPSWNVGPIVVRIGILFYAGPSTLGIFSDLSL